jgi:DNA-binding transcriptional MerR regulator
MEVKIETKSELAERMKINRGTLYSWIRKGIIPPDGPWSLEECLERLEAYKDEQAEQNPDDLRHEKLRLECEKLRVVIAREREALDQQKIDTEERRGRLVDAVQMQADYEREMRNIRMTVENWCTHETAKNPAHAEIIDGIVKSLFTAIIESVERTENP